MSKSLTRRDMVRIVGGVACTGAAAVVMARADQTVPGAKPSVQTLPWKYKPLDPEVAAQRAFEGYNKHHCMFGAFESIVAPIAEELGPPYKDFPFDMMTYGAGGINGWATICGCLNGAAAAFQLLSPKPEPLIDALFAWYEREQLPNVQPKGMKFAEVRSVSGSPLCHQSISHWCAAAKKKSFSDERKERCGTLTASVARQAVLLMNDQAAAKPLKVVLSQNAQNCMSCHEKGSVLENMRAKMDCAGCHAPLIGKHPKAKT